MSNAERRTAIARSVQINEAGNGRLDIRLRVYPDGKVWIDSPQVPDSDYSRTIKQTAEDIEVILHEAWTRVAAEARTP